MLALGRSICPNPGIFPNADILKNFQVELSTVPPPLDSMSRRGSKEESVWPTMDVISEVGKSNLKSAKLSYSFIYAYYVRMYQ
jgi:hypothetical protein